MAESIIAWFEQLASFFPLPLFVILGTFIEEAIAPLPSPLVTTMAGTLVQAQGHGIVYLLFIAAVAAASKTIASVILYYFSDKIEDFLISRFGEFLRISQSDTEGLGRLFNQSNRDLPILLLIRSIPIFPSAPISILCGALKTNINTFTIATFLGSYIKSMIFLVVGYLGLAYLDDVIEYFDKLEYFGYAALIIGAVVFIYKHNRTREILSSLVERVLGR